MTGYITKQAKDVRVGDVVYYVWNRGMGGLDAEVLKAEHLGNGSVRLYVRNTRKDSQYFKDFIIRRKGHRAVYTALGRRAGLKCTK